MNGKERADYMDGGGADREYEADRDRRGARRMDRKGDAAAFILDAEQIESVLVDLMECRVRNSQTCIILVGKPVAGTPARQATGEQGEMEAMMEDAPVPTTITVGTTWVIGLDASLDEVLAHIKSKGWSRE